MNMSKGGSAWWRKQAFTVHLILAFPHPATVGQSAEVRTTDVLLSRDYQSLHHGVVDQPASPMLPCILETFVG